MSRAAQTARLIELLRKHRWRWLSIEGGRYDTARGFGGGDLCRINSAEIAPFLEKMAACDRDYLEEVLRNRGSR